jgi:hypothetical protein
VSNAVFAGSEQGEGKTVTDNGECSSESGRACSSVGSSSEVLSSFVRAGNGSRFWALAEDEVSDDESVPAEAVTPSVGTPAMVISPAVQGSHVWPVEGKELDGKPVKPVRQKLQSLGKIGSLLSAHPKSMGRQGRFCKPWKGPLPSARYARSWSLGDLRVVDCRAGKKGEVGRLVDFAETRGSPEVDRRPPELGEKGGPRRDPVLNFESRCPVALGWAGPGCTSQRRPLEAQKSFRFSEGLGFLGGGKSIGIPIYSHRHPPASTTTVRELQGGAAMAAWQREGRRGVGDREE